MCAKLRTLPSFLDGRFVTAAPEARGIINLKCAQNTGHYLLSAENINFTARHTSLLSELKTKDIQYFKKRWKTANETQKRKIIKQQREIFNVLFQQLNDSSMPTTDKVELLAKITRLSPIFAPYQIRMLNFIKTQNIQSRKEYFDTLLSGKNFRTVKG